MVLYLLFFATATGVAIIAVDPGDPDVMHRPPRNPKLALTNRAAVTMWIGYAAVLFVAALIPLIAGPDEPSTEHATISMTMTFAVMGLGTVFNAIANRRDPGTGFGPPILKALVIALVLITMLLLGTQLHLATSAADHHPDFATTADLRRPGRPPADRDRDQQRSDANARPSPGPVAIQTAVSPERAH